MTLVVGYQSGDRIVMLADTMISDATATRPDIVPGQLKLIILGMTLSVAFAGQPYVALKCIRDCKAAIETGGGLDEVLRLLVACSGDGRCDFLVTSHEGDPVLLKVRDGRVSDPQARLWLGDPDAMRLLERVLSSSPLPDDAVEGFPGSAEEYRLAAAFNRLMPGAGRANDVVGGFAISLLASPYGHTYPIHFGAYREGPVYVGRPVSPDEIAGCPTFAYQQFGCPSRGVALTAIRVQETGVTYLYNPLVDDHPRVILGLAGEQVYPMLAALAEGRGGVPESVIQALP